MLRAADLSGKEGHGELALCYYKGPEDKEVRGWVFLEDFSEIAETGSDLMIFTSPARTLRLSAEVRGTEFLCCTLPYISANLFKTDDENQRSASLYMVFRIRTCSNHLQTRAEHRLWIISMCTLCPGACAKLETTKLPARKQDLPKQRPDAQVTAKAVDDAPAFPMPSRERHGASAHESLRAGEPREQPLLCHDCHSSLFSITATHCCFDVHATCDTSFRWHVGGR